jgi:hypothetical protein
MLTAQRSDRVAVSFAVSLGHSERHGAEATARLERHASERIE